MKEKYEKVLIAMQVQHSYYASPSNDNIIVDVYLLTTHVLALSATATATHYPLYSIPIIINSGCGKERRILIGPW